MEVPKCVLVPKFAYRYWPKGEEAVQAPGKYGTRLIFSRQEYADSEEDLLEQLQDLLDSASRKGLVESVQRHDMLRYIYAAKWDVRNASSMLLRHLSWIECELPSIYPSSQLDSILVSPTQLSGSLYLHGRDLKYRPVIVLTPARLREFPIARVMKTAVFLMEYVLDHMLLSGQIESVGLIADCQDGELIGYSVEEIKQAIDFLMLHYPCRLAWGFVVNGKYSLWSRLTAFLDPDTSTKFVLNPTPAQVLSVCHASQLEVKFGGSSPTLTSYWPPNFPAVSRSLGIETINSFVTEYSSYQEYHPERSLTETSGFEGTATDRGTPVRELVEGMPGDQALTLESDSSDMPEVQTPEDRELNEAMETLRGKIQLTKMKYRAYTEHKHMMTLEKSSIAQRGWCTCIIDNAAQESKCVLW